MTASEIVRLASFGTLVEAHACRLALEQEGIRCQVVGDYLTAGYGLGLLPGTYAEVWVRHEDLDRARAILGAQNTTAVAHQD
jgi:hypothetical protein